MSSGGYSYPPGSSTASILQARRLSGALPYSYDRPPAAHPVRGRSPSPGPSRRYNSYDDYPPPRGGYSAYRSNSNSYRDSHSYHPPEPLPERHYDSHRDVEPDHWDRSAPWQPPPEKSSWDRRSLTLSPTSSVVSRDRIRNDPPRLFEPSDAWKQTQNDRPTSVRSPQSPRHGRNFRDQSPNRGRSPPYIPYRTDQNGRSTSRINNFRPNNNYRQNANRYRDGPRRRSSSISSSRSRSRRSRSRTRSRSRSRSRGRRQTSVSNSYRRSISRYTGSDRRRSKSKSKTRSRSRSSIASSRASERAPSRRVSPVVIPAPAAPQISVRNDDAVPVISAPSPPPPGISSDIIDRGPSHSPVPGLGNHKPDHPPSPLIRENSVPAEVVRIPSRPISPETTPVSVDESAPLPEEPVSGPPPTNSGSALPTWDVEPSIDSAAVNHVASPIPPADIAITPIAEPPLLVPRSPARISMSPPPVSMSSAPRSPPPTLPAPRSPSPMQSVEVSNPVPVETAPAPPPKEDVTILSRPKIEFSLKDIPALADAKNIVDALRCAVAARLRYDRQTRDEVVEPILSENLALESPTGEPPLKPQAQLVDEVSVQRFNGARDDPFLAAKPWLCSRFAKRQSALTEKTVRLQQEYQALHTEWRRHCNSISVCVKPVETESIPVPGRTTRRTAANLGDTVRSDLEMEQIIASLGYDEATDPNQLSARNLAVIPDMISVTGQTKYVYDDTNHLVEDPASYYALNTGIHDWTDQEKETFLDKYAAFPKQFGTISSFLPNKSASQCVDYYYLHKKKLIDFRRVVSQFAPGKRRGRRPGKQKGNGLLSDIRQHDLEVHRDSDDSPSYHGPGRPTTRGRRGGAPDSVRKPSGRRNALQLDTTSTATPTPEPEARPKRRRVAALAGRSGLYIEDGDDDTDGEPKKKRRGRKPKSAAIIVAAEELVTPAVTPPPTMDMDLPPATIEWSEDDKVLFLELLAQHGENFKRIAVAMPNKTTAQVSGYFKEYYMELDLGSIAARAVENAAATAGDGDTTLSSVPSPLASADAPLPQDDRPPSRNGLDANEMWDSMAPGSGVQSGRASPVPAIAGAPSRASERPVESVEDTKNGLKIPSAPVMSSLTYDRVWASYQSAENATTEQQNATAQRPTLPTVASPAAASSRPSIPYPIPYSSYYMPYPPPYSGQYKSS